MGGACGTYVGKTNALRMMMRRPEGTKVFGKKPVRRWENHLKWIFKEIGQKGLTGFYGSG